MSLLAAFTTAVLPIVVMAGTGYALGVAGDVDVGPLNTVALYVLVPALTFHSLVTTTLSGTTVAKIGVGVLVYTVAMMGIATVVGRFVGVSESLLSVLVLASAFPNSGFYGIPLSRFAFGDVGETAAVIYLTAQNLLVYTLGVYVASRGSGSGGRAAAGEIFRLPLVYAAVAAVLARWAGTVPPAGSSLMATVEAMGDASIPLMLVILGVQLANTRLTALSRVAVPTALKLGVAPVVGLGIALALAFDDPTVARVFVVECATPAAVIPLVLVIEYSDAEASGGLTAPEYMSTVIFVTTAASVVVLTVLVSLLQAGTLV